MTAHATKQTKHIFVTGGVVSSLGKGLTSASIGMLLEHRGLRVRLQKFDPYINVDPGTMDPYQHGEVYVLDDGTETDLDLGHYERFTSAPLTRDCNFTTGRIYESVIKKERRGAYKGHTVQVIPHVTDEIKAAVRKLATDDVDVVITEIGGTVGDIEGLPFLEAIRQFALDIGKHNCLYIHLTLIPYLKAAGEAKTKPTQHSVERLRQIGIQPDILICRTERELSKDSADKIALFCNVEKRAVIEERDKAFSIYEVPISLVENHLDELIVEKLGLRAQPLDMNGWRTLLQRITNPVHETTIAVVGKYIKHQDAYKSVYESLDHAGIALASRVVIRRIEAEEVEREGAERVLGGVDGILVPGGFNYRGVGGKVEAIRFARERQHPIFRHLPGTSVCRHRVRSQRRRPGGRQLDGDGPQVPSSRRVPARRPVRHHGPRRHDASGQLSLCVERWLARPRSLRRRAGEGTAPPSLRVQQPVSPAVRRPRHGLLRHQPGRQARGDDRTAESPLVRGGAVPPGVPVETDAGASAFPQFRQGGAGEARSAKKS